MDASASASATMDTGGRELKLNKMKRDSHHVPTESEDDGDEEEEEETDKRKRVQPMKNGPIKTCQADNCSADLTAAKTYHRRHKVCELHAKAQVVLVAGIRQRFCQQCSRFHEVSEFDEAKRSCRRRLAGHNERRRKNPSSDNSQAEGSTSSSRMKGNSGGQLKDTVCRQVDDRGRIQITVQETSTYKHFHVR